MASGYYNSTGLPYNQKPPVETQFKKGHKGYWSGKKMPPRTKEWNEKISESHRGDKNPMYGILGERNPRWIKDRTLLKKTDHRANSANFEWKRLCKERDKHTCRIADENCTGGLEVHHILGYKDYPELRYEMNNGITLCHFHHPRSRAKEKELSPYFQVLITQAI